MEGFTIKFRCKRNVRGVMKKNLFFILFFLLNINNAYSLIEVDITRGNLNPLPIAVSPLFSDSDTKQELKNETNISSVKV